MSIWITCTCFSKASRTTVLLSTLKSVFWVNSTTLPFWVDSSSIYTLPSQSDAVRNFQCPSNSGKLHSFLGLINLYHQFLTHAGTLVHPMHWLCHSSFTPNPLSWNDDFQSLLCSAALLTYPSPGVQLRISSDVSDPGTGAVLDHNQSGIWLPLSFFSKLFSPSESKYCTFDMELLVAYLADYQSQPFIGASFPSSPIIGPLSMHGDLFVRVPIKN